MTAFKPGETYRTRDGREARVYAVDGGGSHPIHGAIKTDFGWESENWRENGSVYSSEPRGQADLMPPKRELWVIAPKDFKNGDRMYGYTSSDDAIDGMNGLYGRWAMIGYIECEGGQFDE